MPPRRKQKTAHKKSKKSTVGRRAKNRAHIAITARDRAAGKWFEKLVALQARLRGPQGCPWDREQTHASLRKYLIEEMYEVLDAMDSGDPRKFSEELGDLLLQVVFHAILAEETRSFTMSDIIEGVHTKMVRRHPHVFGDAEASTSAAVLRNWEEIKAEERAGARASDGKSAGNQAVPDSIVGGVPRSLPAVLEAYQLTRRASRVGFDWDDLADIFNKLAEEKQEIEAVLAGTPQSKNSKTKPSAHLEEEVGDLLFAGVNIARFLGVDPEIALKAANRKFKQRFQWMESAAEKEGKRFAELPRPRMEELWEKAKRA